MINCLVHRYVNDVTEFIDGANLYYVELASLLRKFNSMDKVNVIWHDLFSDLKDNNLIKRLSKTDVVLCCVGPYAYIYHYFRELYNLDFRIIRDIHTTYWGGYMLQEFLCNPLLREEDVVLVPSCYNIQTFKEIFKTERYLSNSVIFNPSVDGYPNPPKIIKENCNDQTLKIGYLGRISKDKNFDQVLELSKQLAKTSKVKLYIAGGVYRNQFNLLKLENYLKRHNVYMRYEGYVKDIWDFFKKFDVFLFFSTSNVESLGRVVLEAINARKKILTANFAALPELLPPDSLLPVNYFNLERTCNDVFPLGYVDISNVNSLMISSLQPASLATLNRYRNSFSTLLKTLQGKIPYLDYCEHHDFLPRVKNIPAIRIEDSMSKIRKIISFLYSKSSENLPPKIKPALSILLKSKNRRRSLRFLSYYWRSKVSYSTLGHFPIESCWINGFNPILYIPNNNVLKGR